MPRGGDVPAVALTGGDVPLDRTRVDQDDEAAWLPAARRGETWALECMYRVYRPLVRRVCYRLLDDADDADDATQAAFIQAFRGVRGFRGECALKTWLYRIAVNEAVSLRRKRHAGVPWEGESCAPPPGDPAPVVAERLVVQAAMARLRPDHRAVLVLRYWEDLSYREIADVLGVSMPAVKMRLSRAKVEFLARYEEGP